MKFIIIALLFVGTSLFNFQLSAHAQMTSSLKLVPNNPEPRSTVTLTLESYSFNVNTADITWKSSGKVLLTGPGEKSLTVKTGEVGETSQINVIATLADGSTIEQSVTISPSSVMLLYESFNSYVPIFYEGRSLPAAASQVRVTAFPSMSDKGQAILPSRFSYSWYVNNSLVKNVSGLGKQTAVLTLDYLKNKTDVRVLISSPQGSTSEKTITIYPHAVMPLLYTYDSILGVNFNIPVTKRFETTQEFTLALEPYYVSRYGSKEPTFTWFLDGLPSTPLGARLLSLQPKENSYGSKLLSIDVSGGDKLQQKATIKTEIIFDTRK